MCANYNYAGQYETATAIINTVDLTITISNILHQLGIPANLKGYIFLREAIILKVNSPNTEIPVTKILYPDIAKKFKTTSCRVERTIRHAIEVAWNRGDQSYQFQIFSRIHKQKPSNSEFIKKLAAYIIWLHPFQLTL